jgi:hypothetical protein
MTFVSCNPQQKQTDLSYTQTTGGASGGANNNPPMAMQPRLAKVMSYNQYNMTLSKLTGINTSQATTIFEQIKGSLPADTNIDAMTSFNLVAKTRLADFYCGIFISSLPSNFDFSPTSIKNHLMTTFLDYDPNLPNQIFDSLLTEVDNVLANNDGHGGQLITATNLSALQKNKNLSVMACVTILASSHITIIE